MEDTPLYNSRLIKTYIEYIKKTYGEINLDAILREAGITMFELEDGGHWFTQRQSDLFNAAIRRETSNPNISREVGRYCTSAESWGPIRQYILAFLLLDGVFSIFEKVANTLTKGSKWQINKLKRDKFEVFSIPMPGVKEKPYQCETRIGILEAIAYPFANDYAHIDHPVCLHRGGDYCHYIVTTKIAPVTKWRRFRNLGVVISLLAAIATLSFVRPLHWESFAVFTALFIILGISLYVEYLEKKGLFFSIRTQGDAAERLLNQIDLRYNEALLVKEIGQATSMILDIDELLKFVIETLEKRLDFERGMIMLANKERTLLQYMVGYGYNPEHEGYLRKTQFHLDRENSKGPAVVAFKEQRPFIVNNISELNGALSSSSREFAKTMGAESFICVPIVYETESMGVLLVDNIKSKRSLSQSDVSILLGIAPQIAISMKNSLSYQLIMESEERFRSLSENAPDIIYTLGIDGTFAYVNPAWERILGYPTKEVIGRQFADFMRKEDVPFYTRLLDLVKHERRIFRDEIGVLIHRDGSYRYFSISSAPNLDAEDKVIGFVGIFKDITDLKLSQEELKKSYQKLQGTLDVTIQAISMIVEARDPYTSGHQVRVAKLSSAIARELGLSEDHIRGIRMAALIHDIGKINVPAEILSKPTRLNDIELSMVRAHPQVGYNILKTIDFPFPVEKVVLQHHERLDGSGYPNGLSGDDIILEARILGVSDVVESMASHRPYRPAMGIEAALARIRQEKGTCFDPSVVDACVDLFQNKGFVF